MSDIAQQASAQLIQYGVLGIVVIVFGWVIYQLWRENKAERADLMLRIDTLQAARVADAQRHQQEFSDVIRSCTEALTTVTATLSAQREAMTELRDAFRDIGDELKVIGRHR